MPTLFGIKTCDTCRKAVKALEADGQTVTFRDVRSEPLSANELDRFLDTFGDAILNTRSTTWRGLDASDKARDPKLLLQEHPTLMKRPVIEGKGGLTLGWNADAQAKQLG